MLRTKKTCFFFCSECNLMLYVNPNILSKNVQLQMMREKFGPLKTIIISNEWSITKFSLVVQKSLKYSINVAISNTGLKLLFLFQNGKPISSSWKVFHFNNNKLYTYTKLVCLMKISVRHTSIFILNHHGKKIPFYGW